MRPTNRQTTLVLSAAALMACDAGVTTPTPETLGVPITTFTTPATGACPPDSAHQGRALANYLRDLGYTVTELGRGATLPTDSMRTYATVMRAGYYYDAQRPGYSAADLAAYAAYLACPRTLVLLGEFLRDGRRDVLADSLGIPLTGIITSTITDFTAHALTAGVGSVPFIAGSYLQGGASADVHVLGRLPTGEAVMGVLAKGESKVFFIGDMNGIQQLPQPLVQNLVAWGFR